MISSENSAIIGGGFFMRFSSKKIGTAIDLTEANLDFIAETDDTVEIGAMTTADQLQRNAILQKRFDGLIPTSVGHLPGVQMRNMVTVGGTVSGKYGFSELITGLLALESYIKLNQGGLKPIDEFLATKGKLCDIVEKVIIKKANLRSSYQSFRNSSGSLPMLTVAVSRSGNDYRIAVGARPAVASLAVEAMRFLSENEVSETNIAESAEIAGAELEISSDRRASGNYRRELCKVLVRRAVMEVKP
jgi:CO/xanthine dehydrogenase FAD-binding subunit